MKKALITFLASMIAVSAFGVGRIQITDADGNAVTVTNGTALISGTVTAIPSGTQTVESVGLANVQVMNASTNAVEVDPITRALVVVDYSHHEIHEGDHFFCGAFNVVNDGSNFVALITTTNTTKWAHMVYAFGGTLDTDIYVYEGATNTAGTALTCLNNNRNSTNTAVTAVNETTGTANGTLIYSTGFGTDSGGGATRKIAGGAARGDSEFILKQNTKYLIIMTSNSDANKLTMELEWYEHISKTD